METKIGPGNPSVPSNAACTLLFNVWVLTAETDPGPVAVDGGFVRLICWRQPGNSPEAKGGLGQEWVRWVGITE